MIALFLLFISVPRAQAENPTVYVDVNPKVYDSKKFKPQKGLEVREIKPKKTAQSIPNKTARDAIYKKVRGLDKYVESMDQLDKDMLYIHAKTNEIKPLEKLYPAIPSKILLALQEQIKKEK